MISNLGERLVFDLFFANMLLQTQKEWKKKCGASLTASRSDSSWQPCMVRFAKSRSQACASR